MTCLQVEMRASMLPLYALQGDSQSPQTSQKRSNSVLGPPILFLAARFVFLYAARSFSALASSSEALTVLISAIVETNRVTVMWTMMCELRTVPVKRRKMTVRWKT